MRIPHLPAPGVGISLGLTLGSVATIGWLDFVTGPEFGLSLFLAVPVFMAARASVGSGLVVSVVAMGSWITARVVGVPTVDRPGLFVWNAVLRGVFFAVIVALAITKRRMEFERTAAATDVLTGINNRRGFEVVLQRELARSRRSGRPLTVVYLDCDNFKAINDRYGHATGNELLRVVAVTLVSGFREVDAVARIGGDEFAALLVDAELDGVRAVLDRVVVALREAVKERGWPVTFSVGAATSVHPADTADQALAEADRLMYRAKAGGKDAIVHEVILRPKYQAAPTAESG